MILQNVADLEKEAEKFVCEGFATGQEALSSAVDILVEALSEDVNFAFYDLSGGAETLQTHFSSQG